MDDSHNHKGALEKLLVALVEPGTGHLLLPYINGALVLLVVVLIVLTATGHGSIHLVVMSVLALGLMLSVNWFVSEVRRLQAANPEGAEGGAGGDSGTEGKEKGGGGGTKRRSRARKTD